MSKTLSIVVVTVFLVLSGVVAGVWFSDFNKKSAGSQLATEDLKNGSIINNFDIQNNNELGNIEDVITTHVKNRSAKWLGKYKEVSASSVSSLIHIAHPDRFNDSGVALMSGTKAYKIGEDSNGLGEILLVVPMCDGMGCFGAGNAMVFVINGDKKEYIEKNSSTKGLGKKVNWNWFILNGDVSINSDSVYSSLIPEKEIKTTAGDIFYTRMVTPAIPANTHGAGIENRWLSSAQIMRVKDFGIVSEDNPKTKSMDSFRKKMPAGLDAIYYQKFDFKTDDGVVNVVWNNGDVNIDPYRSDGFGGCGGHGRVSVANKDIILTSDIKVAGKIAGTNKVVYEFTSPYHQIPFQFYRASGGQYYTYDKQTHTGHSVKITAEEWQELHGLFLFKDGSGDYVIFMNSKYGPAAECGKPVIYLYPEKDTLVDVKVSANVRVSEPEYPTKTGWKDVLAKPNGELVYKNNKYPNLFWEGLGSGEYPDIADVGIVVESNDVEKILVTQMTKLGLNTVEINDFLEFWLPHMPKTKYTRLTWFGTNDMNELAPLTVSPMPDTLIRVFLDFEGLDKKVKLKPQKLMSKKRIGFTVVEWGGLLR